MQNDDPRFDVLDVQRPIVAPDMVATCTWRPAQTMMFHRLIVLADIETGMAVGESLCSLTIGHRQLGMGLALVDLTSPAWIDRYIEKRYRIMQCGYDVVLSIHGARSLTRPREVSVLVIGQLPPGGYEDRSATRQG